MIRQEIRISPSEAYVVYLPEGYSCEPQTSWPVVLFLHGSGERGDQPELVDVHGPTKEASLGRSYPFIIFAPQLSPQMGEHWLPETLSPMLEDMRSRFNTDESRWYVTGLSLGGFGAITLLQAWPHRFAAALAISGCNIFDYTSEQLVGPPCKAAHIPTWLVHGRQDDVVPVEQTERYYRLRRDCQSSNLVRFDAVEAGHDAWSAVYAKDEY